MPFLKPTVSSLSRANAIRRDSLMSPATSAHVSQPLVKQLFKGPSDTAISCGGKTADYTHVSSRVDTGLHFRVQNSHLRGRTACRSPSPREFTQQCDSVLIRAQQLLEKTKEQEELVAKALEERLSQSPARRFLSSPKGRGDIHHERHTLTVGGYCSPSVPRAPHTTPVPLRESNTTGHWFQWESPARDNHHSDAATPCHSSVPPCPPTTPVPQVCMGRQEPDRVDAPGESPSLLQRVRQSLQRLSGSLPPAPAEGDSPVPFPVTASPLPERVSQRKSVHFVSPDKLESVTPTVIDALSDDESSDEVEMPRKKLHVEGHGDRMSVSCPPAPPSSLARSGSKSPTGPAPLPAESSKPSTSQPKTVKKGSKKAMTASEKDRKNKGRAPVSHTQEGDMVAFIQAHSNRKCLSTLSKRDILSLLKSRGDTSVNARNTKKDVLYAVRQHIPYQPSS